MAKPKIMSAKSISLAALQDWSASEWSKYEVEPKFDGLRFCRANRQWLSRGGKEYYGLDEITTAIDAIKDIDAYLIDGEIVGDDWSHAMSVSGHKSADGKQRYVVFDAVPLNGELSLFERRENLHKLFKSVRNVRIQLVEAKQVGSYDEFKELFDFHVASGCDGSMLKLRTGVYERKRSRHWLKVKDTNELDCKVVAFKPGKPGKYENTLGSVGIVVPLPKGKWSEHVTYVSGMDDKLRDWIWRHQKQMIGKIVEVRFRKMSKKNKLIEPRLYRQRLDKGDATCRT